MKVYMHDLSNKLIKIFNTTNECAEYFEKGADYIRHNMKYCQKIQRNGKWYKLSRKEIK